MECHCWNSSWSTMLPLEIDLVVMLLEYDAKIFDRTPPAIEYHCMYCARMCRMSSYCTLVYQLVHGLCIYLEWCLSAIVRRYTTALYWNLKYICTSMLGGFLPRSMPARYARTVIFSLNIRPVLAIFLINFLRLFSPRQLSTIFKKLSPDQFVSATILIRSNLFLVSDTVFFPIRPFRYPHFLFCDRLWRKQLRAVTINHSSRFTLDRIPAPGGKVLLVVLVWTSVWNLLEYAVLPLGLLAKCCENVMQIAQNKFRSVIPCAIS